MTFSEYCESKGLPNPRWFIPAALAISLLLFAVMAHADTLTASWYSRESCLREGTSGIMANGRRLDDTKFTCASWDYSFGTLLKITNLKNNKFCIVEVTDRGPTKKLWRQGRVIDLSRQAFKIISGKQGLDEGVLKIKIEVIQ